MASSNASAQKKINTSFGTNSPPLEATGSAKPMGMASVDGTYDAGFVSDGEQRKAYFSSSTETEKEVDSQGKPSSKA